MRKYNQVYFNDDTVEYTKGLLPQNFINKWGIKFKEPTDGCVRTKNGEVIAFYFYINTTNQNNSILKFNFNQGDIEFDSIYVQPNIEEDEVRYNVKGEEIAHYKFDTEKYDQFCVQSKPNEKNKIYEHIRTPKVAIESLEKFSEQYLTKSLKYHSIDYFITKGNDNEKYWFIR